MCQALIVSSPDHIAADKADKKVTYGMLEDQSAMGENKDRKKAREYQHMCACFGEAKA